VLTLHDYFLGCPNGGLFVYPEMSVCHRTPLSLDCFSCRCDSRNHAHKLWRFARTWIQNRVADLPRRLDCVIALSTLNRDTARTFLPTDTPIVTVPNPVDVSVGAPVDVEQNDAFVFAGRLEPYKGPQLLAAAAARNQARAVFCGDGPAADLVRDTYPAARVTGWLDPVHLQTELSSARALVFPSLWPETFGLTALEALARGIPVIASRGTAAEEQIEHDVNGLLFERGSVDDLAAMMRRLDDPATAARLGREAHRRYWRNPYTLTRHVKALEQLFGSLGAIRSAA
jgi:glycosyltransferase involved in cell wall biosynthesis